MVLVPTRYAGAPGSGAGQGSRPGSSLERQRTSSSENVVEARGSSSMSLAVSHGTMSEDDWTVAWHTAVHACAKRKGDLMSIAELLYGFVRPAPSLQRLSECGLSWFKKAPHLCEDTTPWSTPAFLEA
jgi:hypothetical protein